MAHEGYAIFEKNFPKIMASYKPKFLQKLKSFNDDHVQKQVMPVMEAIAWPLIMERCKTELAPITQEMWQEFPKLNLVLLWIYQSLPGTSNDHVRKRLEKYLQQKALPIMKKHRFNVEKLSMQVLVDIGKDKRVRQLIKKTIIALFRDQEMQRLWQAALQELYDHNKRELVVKLQEKWFSRQFQQKLTQITQKFEPYLITMVNKIMLHKNQKEICPELAKVLRRQIFFKDRYCLEMHRGQTDSGFLLPKKFAGRQE